MLIGITIPLALATNIVRIVGTGILARYLGTEVAEGFFSRLFRLGRVHGRLCPVHGDRRGVEPAPGPRAAAGAPAPVETAGQAHQNGQLETGGRNHRHCPGRVPGQSPDRERVGRCAARCAEADPWMISP